MLVIKKVYRVFDDLYETHEQAETWLTETGWDNKERVKMFYALGKEEDFESYPIQMEEFEGYIFRKKEHAEFERVTMEED